MVGMRSHEDLEVWKRSIDLTVRIYRITAGFPDSEKFGLSSQLRRATVSVSSNIAEGAAQGTTKSFINFLYISRGSISEVGTQVEIARRLRLIDTEVHKELKGEIIIIGKMLTNLIKRLKQS